MLTIELSIGEADSRNFTHDVNEDEQRTPGIKLPQEGALDADAMRWVHCPAGNAGGGIDGLRRCLLDGFDIALCSVDPVGFCRRDFVGHD